MSSSSECSSSGDTGMVSSSNNSIDSAVVPSSPARMPPATPVQVNPAIADYLEMQGKSRKEEQVKMDREFEFKRAKAEKEEKRWEDDLAFRKAQAE